MSKRKKKSAVKPAAKAEISTTLAKPANGKLAATPPPVSPSVAPAAAKSRLHPREARQERMSQTFSQVVAVLMRDPVYRNLKLADLEWLVLPPIMAGQWRIGQTGTPAAPAKTQPARVLIPVAVALWARVSAGVDKRLSANLDRLDLKPDEWASGDIVWLIASAGDPRALPKFIKELVETEFKGRPVKFRTRGPDGKSVVKIFNGAPPRS